MPIQSATVPARTREDRTTTELTLHPSWRSFAGTQGGLLLGHLLAAAENATGQGARTATAHFLAAAPPGPASTRAQIDRRGSSSCSVRTELQTGDGTTAAVAQVLTVRPRPSALVEHRAADAGPTRVDPAELDPFALPVDYVPFGQHLDYRPVGEHRPLGGGPLPRLTGWVRLLADVPPLVAIAVLLDCLPPSLFATFSQPVSLPTVELTAHLSATVPTAGTWLLLDQSTRWHDGDLALDDATLTDQNGTLVAQCRQTRRVPSRPPFGVGSLGSLRVPFDPSESSPAAARGTSAAA